MKSKFLDLYNLVMEHLINEASEINFSKIDVHETLTGILLLLNNELTKKTELNISEMDSLLNECYEFAKLNKGTLLHGITDDKIEAILQYSKKYNALCQALSCVNSIKKTYEMPAKTIFFTGNKAPNEISRFFGIPNLEMFGIDSYGMKDFNSSDIVFISNNDEYIGISLKKKDRETSTDPTLTNVAISTLFNDAESLEKLDKLFNKFFIKVINDNINDILNNDLISELFKIKNKIKYSSELQNSKNENEFKNNFKKELNKNNVSFKNILSRTNGLFLLKESRDFIRNIINLELKKSNSVLKDIDKLIISKSEEIGNAFFHIAFKDSLENLKDQKFNFSLCVGIGKFSKTFGYIDKAEMFTITDLTEYLRKIENKSNEKKKIVSSSDERKNNSVRFDVKEETKIDAAKLFYDLNIGNTTLANIEIRYKGDFVAYPQVFATFDKKFVKNFFIEKSKK